MKKNMIYFKLNILYMFRNKVRFILTVLGISIGLFIYLVGNIAIDTYINYLYKNAYNFAGDSYVVRDETNKILDRIRAIQCDIDVRKYSFMLDASYVNYDYYYKNMKISNATKLIGVNSGVNEVTNPYLFDSYIYAADINIIYGRDFTSEEIKGGSNSIIIERSAAEFLFQKENAVGEYIDYVSTYGYRRFEIVGIIENLPVTKENNLLFNKAVKDGGNEFVNVFNGYVPTNALTNLVGENGVIERYVVRFNDEDREKFETAMDSVNKEIEIFNLEGDITSRKSIVNEIKELENEMRGYVNVLMNIIILISGMMIMNIYFFSVKERMYEIGVRRALGGSGGDIVIQLLLEGMITAFIATVVTLVTTIILSNFIVVHLVENNYMDVKLAISKEKIFSTLGLSMLEGIMFSLFPAIYSARIRPTDAIRWD